MGLVSFAMSFPDWMDQPAIFKLAIVPVKLKS
jgi:hypothetical protein